MFASATHSLENVRTSPRVTPGAKTKTVKSAANTDHWNPSSTTHSKFPRRKSLEFEDLLSGETSLRLKTPPSQKQTNRSHLQDSLLYDNPFDACLFRERHNPMTSSAQTTLTPLRHVTNENVFLDVADRISRVMEEYTSKHRSQLGQVGALDADQPNANSDSSQAAAKMSCLQVGQKLQDQQLEEREQGNAVRSPRLEHACQSHETMNLRVFRCRSSSRTCRADCTASQNSSRTRRSRASGRSTFRS